MRSSTVLLAAALLVAGTTAQLTRHWGGRHRGGFVQLEGDEKQGAHAMRHDSRLEVSGIASIQQKIDHFNASDARTFKQRYFFNNEHNQDKKGNVNFLYLSGEQTASLNQITGSTKPIVKYADRYAANLYCLEHRYYGESRPFLDTSTENLKYLSSRQAIEDVASFIKEINTNSGSPSDQKWVIVGGSYAGNLAAWSRQLHPELITGAIASSAPLLAQFDFYGYLETVEKNVQQYPTCAAQLKAGIQKISDYFESANGRATLDKTFVVSPKLATYTDLQDNDIVIFFSWVTDIFEGASQYGSPKSVGAICNEFTANVGQPGYDPVVQLAALIKNYNSNKDGSPFTFNVNYTAGVEDMLDTSYGDHTDYTGRLWTYQTCTEFGYFQSTDKGTNIFQSIVPVNIFVDTCKDVFDIDVDSVKKSIDDTNAYYGERDYYTGTKVFFAHGTSDPWSYLTKQLHTSQHWSVVTAEIEGGTHCSDLNPACDENGNNCNVARQQVQTLTQANIEQWLNGPFTAPDSIKLTDNVGKRPDWYSNYVGSPLSISSNDAGRTANGPDFVSRAKRSTTEYVRARNGTRRRSVFTGKSKHFLLPPPAKAAKRPEWPVNIEEGRVSQPWDHFDPNNEKTFNQRFFVNEIYVKTDANGVKSKTAPNFLMIGGEGPESNTWVTNEDYAWMTYAKEVGANVYILEHRYYGESKLNTLDLQYLTSSQMLYDVARFISIVKSARGATGPWITFGGSYPGALAAWSREWFPEVIIGAVGSSGPVLAKNDFFEYLQVVENVLRSKSQHCADRVRDAFDSLRKLTRDASGRATITKKFNVVPAWTSNVNEIVPTMNIQTFFGNIYGVFQDVVQYSDDNKKNGRDYTVTELCSIMEDEGTYPEPMDAVRYVQKWVYDDYGNPETSANPMDDINDMKQMWKYIDGHADANGQRPWSDGELSEVLWTWQTCNEFGYYQTTDYGEGIFGNPVPLNFFVYMCEQVFGVTMDHIEKGVARSNYQYGGRNRYSATNVVLPNGNHDPWHALGITEQGKLDPSVVPILIDGTAHCADMYPACTTGTYKEQRCTIDSPQLVTARQTILSNIKKWLNGGTPVDVPTQPTVAPPSPPTTTSASGISLLIAALVSVLALLI